ncbi:MAG: metal-dependent hydrolase, partial [Dehalococcoidia bacterium]|nr:metal-dependent hydrolase [Dehalococcoidia bacterium]
PIGGHFTMGPREAALACRLLEVPRVIPMHFGTFPVLTGTPAALQVELGDQSGIEVVALEPGSTQR